MEGTATAVAASLAAAPTVSVLMPGADVTFTPVPTMAPTAVVVEVIREIVVTSPPEVIIERVYIPEQIEVEVTRIVEVTPVPLPTLTPVPLVAGTVKICVDGAGLKAIYVDGQGIVGGGCQIWQVGVGASYITVQINR